MMELAAVVTTIQPPTTAMVRLHARLLEYKAPLIVVGDRKGPTEYLHGADLWTIHRQGSTQCGLPVAMPENHYARKNVGYLAAMCYGVQSIYETDDDNFPTEAWKPRNDHVEARVHSSSCKWFNAYRCFTGERIWPRGLPVNAIDLWDEPTPSCASVWSPIQQGLADNHPDVDAIWRIANGNRPVTFNRASPVAVKSWCPFNSQNTWWFPQAYPLMYLPSHCSFRMTDIWRSFVAQRCLWDMGGVVTFHAPDVVQDRNIHDLQRDLMDEVPGYKHNELICSILDDLVLVGDASENLRRCYVALIKERIFPEEELRLVDLWLEDIARIAYP